MQRYNKKVPQIAERGNRDFITFCKSSIDTFKAIPIQSARIDSLTLFIPLSECEVLDVRLTSSVVYWYDDVETFGDDPKRLPPQPIVKDLNDGITHRLSLFQFPNEDFKRVQIVVTTKYLKEQYFEGITIYNFHSIVDTINAHGLIKVSLKGVFNAVCNDIDICTNHRLDFESYKTALPIIHDGVIDTKRPFVKVLKPEIKGKKSKRRNDPNNIGLQFNEKRKSGSIKMPFIKYYNKENEILTNSVTFYNRFLKDYLKNNNETVKDLKRVESTVKNYRHREWLIKRLQITDNELKTFGDWLTLPQLTLDEIHRANQLQYFSSTIRTRNKNLTPLDQFLCVLIHDVLEGGKEPNDIYKMLDFIESDNKNTLKSAKSRLSKKLDFLIPQILYNGKSFDLEKLNRPIVEFLNELGLWDVIQPTTEKERIKKLNEIKSNLRK